MSLACALTSQITLNTHEKETRENLPDDVAPGRRRRFTGRMSLRLAVYLLAIPIVTLYVLIICDSLSHLGSIYLLRLSSTALQDPPSLRVGDIATCISTNPGLTCTSTPGKSVAGVASHLELDIDTFGPTVSPTLDLQRNHFLPLPAAAGLLSLFSLLSFAVLHRWPESKYASHLRLISLVSWTAAALITASTISIMQTALGLQYFSNASQADVHIAVGTRLQALQWTAVGLSLLHSIVVTTILSVTRNATGSRGPTKDDVNVGSRRLLSTSRVTAKSLPTAYSNASTVADARCLHRWCPQCRGRTRSPKKRLVLILAKHPVSASSRPKQAREYLGSPTFALKVHNIVVGHPAARSDVSSFH